MELKFYLSFLLVQVGALKYYDLAVFQNFFDLVLYEFPRSLLHFDLQTSIFFAVVKFQIYQDLIFTVADWDSIGRAFSFLLYHPKLDRVF